MEDWVNMINMFSDSNLSNILDKITLVDVISYDLLNKEEDSFIKILLKNQNINNFQQITNSLLHAVCGKQLINSPAIKCQTCSNDLASVICLECFDETKHVGHKYTYLTANGMCDCGFACTIKPEGFCDKHCGNHVIRDFHDEKLIFDEQMCVKVIYTLCCLIAHHLVSGNSARYQDVCSVLKTILYEYPVDFLKSIFTKCLFIDPGKSRMQDFLDFGNFENHILPYHNFYELRQTVHQTGFKHYPLICIISQSEEFIPGLGDQDIAHLLVEYQISEPNFRSLMMYAFYMRYQDLIASCFPQQQDQINSLFHTKIKTPIKFINNSCTVQKQTWCSAPVQLDSNIQIDNFHGIIVNFIELSSYYLTCLQLSNIKMLKCQRCVLTQYLDSFFKHGIEELYFVSKDQKVSNILISKLTILFDNSIQIFSDMLPSLESFNQQLIETNENIHNLREMCYSLLCHIYSMKNSQFDAQISCYKLPILSFMFLLGFNFTVEVKRLRDVQVLQFDKPIKDILQQLIFNGKYFYDFAFEIFTGMIYGHRISTYNFQSSICRVNDDFDSVDLTKNRDFQKQIDNVVQLSTYFLLAYSLNQRFQFCYSNNNVYPQIPYGFGLHTQIPILETDMIQVDHDVLHPLDNQLVIMLSFGLQAYYLYQKQGMFEKPHYEYLKDVVGSIEYTRSLPRYNMPVIAAWAMRTIVSVGLLEGGFFKSLVEVEDYIKCFLYQHPNVLYYNSIYHHYLLLQSVLQSTKQGIFKTKYFVVQLLENLGIINPQTSQIVFVNKREDQQKSFYLVQYSIRILLCLVMKSQFLTAHSELISKYVISFLLMKHQASPSEVQKFFGEMDFYNSERFELILEKFAEKTKFQNTNQQFYKSSNQEIFWQLSRNGLLYLSIFDSFCANIPQFLSTFKTQALKYKVPILPADTFDAPFDRELADQIFTNQHVYDVIFFLVKTGFVDGTFKSSNVINDIYVLLGFKQLIIHNADDLELKKLFNLIPKDQSLYQDQVWIVLQNLMDYQHQEKKSVNKISLQAKLAQLKSKVAPTYELINTTNNEHIEYDMMQQPPSEFQDQLKLIEKYQPKCQVCQDIFKKNSSLCVLGTVLPVMSNKQSAVLGQTCTHVFHYTCTKVESGTISCPVCRCISNVAFPILFSIDTDENISVIIALIINIISIHQHQDEENILQSLSNIQLNSIEEENIKIINMMIQLLLQTAYQQVLIVSSRIHQDNNNDLKYKNKQYQIVIFTSYSLILSANQLYNYCCQNSLLYRTNNQLQTDNLFKSLIMREFADDKVIAQLQILLNKKQQLISQQKFNELQFELSQKEFQSGYQGYQQSLKLCCLYDNIASMQPIKLDQYLEPLIIQEFPLNFSQLLKFPINCHCGDKALCFCVFCNQGLCYKHIQNFSHSQTCQHQGCYYVYQQNIIIFTDFKNNVYFSGGPYLDDNGEDDMQRIKKIPLYRNQQLICNLHSHLLYLNTRQQSIEKGVQLNKLLLLMSQWE
ncbi:E3 ubiquitin-protein ligase [Spironucleus salmonicida]|uniref:E3 ubiquitin-protein ligase n=1 Tax=Spironucleus salmonicida TaxID=348837 RepID=V6LLX8_9EUKA|nr:E3 ubiquitin-protein ligase [Spironucleus salmonicida]|eukprot:EST45218.1 Putative zinc finger in N-recognin (UBR box) domain-containing protein [Spironucleus salmonicida]